MTGNFTLPREASTLTFKIRSCIVRTDLKNKAFSADVMLVFKIRSYSARSDIGNKSARFSGYRHYFLELNLALHCIVFTAKSFSSNFCLHYIILTAALRLHPFLVYTTLH